MHKSILDIPLKANKPLVCLSLFIISFLMCAPNTFALKIEPAKVEINAAPMNVVVDTMKVTNDEQETKTLFSSVELFEARGETGTPFFNPEKKGLSLWTEVPSQITLAPGETKEITYKITVPENAEPGGHFAAIFWSSTPPNSESSQVVIGAKLGMLVLLRVSGEIQEGGGIIEAGLEKNIPILDSLPAKIYYRFQNEGSDRLRPIGEVRVRNILGLTVSRFDANVTQGNILPNSIRRFEISWNERSNEPNNEANKKQSLDEVEGFFGNVRHQFSNFLLGPYFINISLEYGTAEVISTSDKFFVFFFPWQLLLVVSLLITIVIFGFKKYNKWLIKKTLESTQFKSNDSHKKS